MSSYDDLTRAVTRVMDTLCEAGFEMSDADPVELTELFCQLRADGIHETLIAAIQYQVETQRKLNKLFEEEEGLDGKKEG